MAEKRCSETAGAVSFGKIPRLEAEPGHVLTQSNMVAQASENHCGYKGSYFAYPLQCHEEPKALAHWSPAEACTPYADGSTGQQRRMQKALSMLCQSEAEGLGSQGQTARHEKDSACADRDALTPQERWVHYMGPSGLAQQGWTRGYSSQQPPQAPAGLAAPKPVYRNHVSSAEPSCGPKGSLALRTLGEGALKLPPAREWALPSSGLSGCADGPSCSSAVLSKAEAGLLQSPKEASASPAGFSPYRKAAEKGRGAHAASFLEGSFAAMYNSQKPFPEACGGNPGKHAWARPPPPASLLASPQPLVFQDRPPSGYPLGCYPLPSHEPVLLCHQPEKVRPLLALPAYKGFSYPDSDEAQLFPASFFPPTARGYYPLESFLYRAVGPSVGTPSREHDPQHTPRARTDLLRKTPAPAHTPPGKVSRCGSWPGDWREGGPVAKPAGESPQDQRVAPRPQSFQALHSIDQTPGFVNGFGPVLAPSCGAGLCQSGQAGAKEGQFPYSSPKSALLSEAKRKHAEDHRMGLGTCIVISDSPVAPHDTCCRVDQLRGVPKGSDASPEKTPVERARTFHPSSEEHPLPPSPPMPVIHNVFSLAPYREYLEGSASVAAPLSKSCRSEEASLHHTGGSAERRGLPQPSPSGSPEASGVPLLERHGTASDGMASVGQSGLGGDCRALEGESRDRAGTWQSCRARTLPPPAPPLGRLASASCANGRAGDSTLEDHVLDLSFKVEGLAEAPSLQMSPGKTEALERESSTSTGEEASSQPAKPEESSPESNVHLSEVPMKSSSGGRSNFHSSAAFLFKKFRILKSHAAGANGAVQQHSAPSFHVGSQASALGDDFARQQNSDCVATQQAGLPTQQSPQEVATQQAGPPFRQSPQEVATPPEAPLLQQPQFNIKLPAASQALVLCAPAASPIPAESQAALPPSSDSPGQQKSPRQCFTALHSSVCAIISCSVSTSSPEKLAEWLEKAELDRELKEKAVSLAKQKSRAKVASAGPKPPRGKLIWLAFKDMTVLLNKLLSQLDNFLVTRQCPFPHVVRAGAIFIPIHVVKEKLFPNLSGASVDHVLQEHKVELRPTTLSEERLLRDLELKGCTSRMLKLLALRQLPDIYPDLLNLHWHACVKQQLGPSSQAGPHASK
ncbi:uncharacterized protein C15orf39 homolog [Varanus komodoensis]|uniref:uncharacterized protein C15orf39 homolog n=1 Tax=Varanus komodoensis TaxID=61221 RepID=UPI001CF7C8B4|nr:uncharacterized protein C15orf39 homolog [Varanus komodoensis]